MSKKVTVIVCVVAVLSLALLVFLLTPRVEEVDISLNTVRITREGLVQQEGQIVIQGKRVNTPFSVNDEFRPDVMKLMDYSVDPADASWEWQKSKDDSYDLISGMLFDPHDDAYISITMAIAADGTWCVLSCGGDYEGQLFAASAEDTVNYISILDRCYQVFDCRFPKTVPVDISGEWYRVLQGGQQERTATCSLHAIRLDYSNGDCALQLMQVVVDKLQFVPLSDAPIPSIAGRDADHACFEVMLVEQKSGRPYSARITVNRESDRWSFGDWCILELGNEYWGTCFLDGSAALYGNEILDLLYPPAYKPLSFNMKGTEVTKNGNVLVTKEGVMVLDAEIAERWYDKTKVELYSLGFGGYSFPVENLRELYYSDIPVNDYVQVTWAFDAPTFGESLENALLTIQYSREGAWCVVTIDNQYIERIFVVSREEELTLEDILGMCDVVL